MNPENDPIENKVLVVEDSSFVVDALTLYLSQDLMIPFEVARNFRETRRLLSDNPQQFFVAVLDLNLPDAPRGEVVDYVMGKGIPAIILTATYDGSVREQMLEKPIIDYVIKRNLLELEYLTAIIRRVKENIGRSVLVVDDSASCRMILSRYLSRQRLTVLEASSGQGALDVLDAHPEVSLIITDHNMPGMSGQDMILEIRATKSRNELAIIGVSSSENSDLTAQFLKCGANDFFVKPFSYEEMFCRVAQNIDAVENYRRLTNSSDYDSLTHVHSRKYLMAMGEVLNGNAQRDNFTMIVAILRVNEFYDLNDEHGPHAGDQSLIHVAKFLRNAFRQTDVVARLGGAEFCILCVGVEEKGIEGLFQRIIHGISHSNFVVDDQALPLSVSITYCKDIHQDFEARVKAARKGLKAQPSNE